jgi:hypothetical protein
VGGAQVFAGFTVSWIVVLWLREPLVPVMVIVPEAALIVVETVSVELPDPASEVGLKLAVTPEGTLPAVSVTLPLKPFRAPIAIVEVVPPPAVTVSEAGEAEIVKSGGGATTSVTGVECVAAALVPVTASV